MFSWPHYLKAGFPIYYLARHFSLFRFNYFGLLPLISLNLWDSTIHIGDVICSTCTNLWNFVLCFSVLMVPPVIFSFALILSFLVTPQIYLRYAYHFFFSNSILGTHSFVFFSVAQLLATYNGSKQKWLPNEHIFKEVERAGGKWVGRRKCSSIEVPSSLCWWNLKKRKKRNKIIKLCALLHQLWELLMACHSATWINSWKMDV